jgi:hypothetical protein
MHPKEVQEFAQTVIGNVERVIVGKREAIELVMVALLCEGHVLIEDVPGTGKRSGGVTRTVLQAAAMHPRPVAQRYHRRLSV